MADRERIAKALATEFKTSPPGTTSFVFIDSDDVYTITVQKERDSFKSLVERRRGLAEISLGPSGSVCGCCNGTGRAG
jgi:hypothetical protein